MIEQLTALDKKMIDAYRRYHTRNEWQGGTEYVDVDQLLKCYEENKQKLFKMLGNQFILEKDIMFERGADELGTVFSKALYGDDGKLKKFREYYLKKINTIWNTTMIKGFGFDENNEPFPTLYYEMMREENFIQNKITRLYNDKETLSFVSPKDGSKVTITLGMKFMKALGKVVEAYNLDQEMFEEFRIAHSQILNDKKLSGRLCLSIHPLDYMTMSDNESDWGSCMSWRECGCYRRGTVEMMNSPIVVVAYLKSDKDMHLFNQYSSIEPEAKEWIWNNKKWRELFVVHEGEIVGIKGYPYTSRPLEKAVIEWLRELAQINLHHSYTEEIYTHQYPHTTIIDGREYKYSYSTGAMYNDFGLATNGDHQSVYHIYDADQAVNTKVCYSGPAVCLCCGGNIEQTAEAYLLCEDCGLEMMTCDCCGWTGSADDFHYVNGCPVCQSCYEDETYYDPIAGDDRWNDNSTTIALSLVPDRLVQCVSDLTPEERELWDKIHNDIWKDNDWDYAIKDYSDLDLLTSPNSWNHFSTRWGYYFNISEPKWDSGYGYWVSVFHMRHAMELLDEGFHIYGRNATQIIDFMDHLTWLYQD